MKELNELSIPEQVIVLHHFNIDDRLAQKLFGVDDSTYSKIKLLAAERFSPKTVNINPSAYEEAIREAEKNYEAPRTSTKRRKPRGRPGLAIIKAFSLIPSTPVPAAQFANANGISLSVLRQHKRFDRTNMEGRVYVRKDSSTNQLMVWRA